MRKVALGLVLPLLVLLAPACADDEGAEVTTSTSTPSTTATDRTTSTTAPDSTTSTGASEQVPCSTGGSSPAEFDPAGGQYAVYLRGLDVPARTLAFDVVQFLVGEDAAEAYHLEVPDDPEGPPNDYFIVNANPQVREAAVAGDVEVQLVRLDEDGDADLDAGTFDELPGYLADDASPDDPALSHNPYWLTLSDGTITAICEQYVP